MWHTFGRIAFNRLRCVVSFLQGELTITSDMEVLESALFLDQVPPIWTSRAYPSLLGLTSWFVDLLMRLRELETWSNDFVVCLQRNCCNISSHRLIRFLVFACVSVAVVCLAGRFLQSTIVAHCNHAKYGPTQRIAAGQNVFGL